MKHWELAPKNAALLHELGIDFCFTAHGLKKPEHFIQQIKKTVDAGLPHRAALRALTTTPAQFIGEETSVGSLSPGKWANLLIISDSLFHPGAKVMEHWIKGNPYNIKSIEEDEIAGVYTLNTGTSQFTLNVERTKKGYKASLKQRGQKEEKVILSRNEQLINLQFNWDDDLLQGPVRLSGKINFESKIWDGRGTDGEGNWLVWSAIRQEQKTQEQPKDSTQAIAGHPWYPNKAYGWDTLPQRKDFLINNITVWSCDSIGRFIGDVLVVNGKIADVGVKIEPEEGLLVINGKGKHLTPGIVDEHSHIAISKGVNEGSYNNSSMVRIGDVVNPDDINIYRQLSGGVTTAQLLHGSANPIGGQSALVKLKWGYTADAMKIPNAPGFIKFALGENVKQSNWGDHNTIRFPQTRMGVEQVYYDHFYRAMAYDTARSNSSKTDGFSMRQLPLLKSLFPSSRVPLRRDLSLEALVEILNEERFISCHSYRQDEINMLMHVADSMGFTVNTFTHILEGYKVADKLQAHGAHASTFSDWWAYKFEVNDAIPYNAALLLEQGVNTGINSDDAEMGRRLNQEAAKSIKYGGVSEEEALKLVTINPAKMLHLDDRIGSISIGKDADLVIWDGHPLSIYSKVETTFIEGIPFFDRQRDLELREKIKTERARIIRLMLEAKANGEATQSPKPEQQLLYECDTELENYIEE